MTRWPRLKVDTRLAHASLASCYEASFRVPALTLPSTASRFQSPEACCQLACHPATATALHRVSPPKLSLPPSLPRTLSAYRPILLSRYAHLYFKTMLSIYRGSRSLTDPSTATATAVKEVLRTGPYWPSDTVSKVCRSSKRVWPTAILHKFTHHD